MEKDKKTMFREINKPIKDIKCITDNETGEIIWESEGKSN